MMDEEKAPFSVVPWDRCKAVREANESGYWGRCILTKKHTGYNHALYEKPYGIPEWVIPWKPDDFIEPKEI